MVGQREFAIVGGVVEASIHPAAYIERDVLITTTIVDTLSVLVFQLEGLPAKIHLAKAFACTYETLIGGALEADGGTLVVCMVCGSSTATC
jgi:hypothetical protein